jgi:hypothetical protein
MNRKPFNVCSIPNDKFDAFWIDMEAVNNVCHDVKADPQRPGNVLATVRPSRRQCLACGQIVSVTSQRATGTPTGAQQ